MHTDHCLDLVTLRYSYPWIDVAKKRLPVIVPPGSTGQLLELALGAGYANFFDKSFIFVEHDGKRPIEVGNLRLEPVRRSTTSAPGASGWRPMRTRLAYSADTGPCDALPRLADADLLLCEAALRSLDEDDQPQSRGHLPRRRPPTRRAGRVGTPAPDPHPDRRWRGVGPIMAAEAYDGRSRSPSRLDLRGLSLRAGREAM